MAHTDRFERISEIVRLERAAQKRHDDGRRLRLAAEFQKLYFEGLFEAEAGLDDVSAEASLADFHARALGILGDEAELRRMLRAR